MFDEISRHPVIVGGRIYHHSTRNDEAILMSCVSSFYDHWMARYLMKCLIYSNIYKLKFWILIFGLLIWLTSWLISWLNQSVNRSVSQLVNRLVRLVGQSVGQPVGHKLLTDWYRLWLWLVMTMTIAIPSSAQITYKHGYIISHSTTIIIAVRFHNSTTMIIKKKLEFGNLGYIYIIRK